MNKTIIAASSFNALYAEHSLPIFLDSMAKNWQVDSILSVYNIYNIPTSYPASCNIQEVTQLIFTNANEFIPLGANTALYGMRLLCMLDMLVRYQHADYLIWLDNDICCDNPVTNDVIEQFLPQHNELISAASTETQGIEPAFMIINGALARKHNIIELLGQFIQKTDLSKLNDKYLWPEIIHECDMREPTTIHNLYDYDVFQLQENIIINAINNSHIKDYIYHAQYQTNAIPATRPDDSLDTLLLYDHQKFLTMIAPYNNPTYHKSLLHAMRKKRAQHSFEDKI